ncbi:50S ribosomal protein L4 [Agrococcus sediminis]|jgi:large subunit ribosomal protein L4|uniref:Large ribosomal subunit protein uL4 n=1 Tax=Agrococcus sediminis TaxID=2599924 RepID=A0A5M8QGB1_9MICO|nr:MULTISPECIES: 50S ribosomal protein L4 [Agrococcus]KAA6435087.1 50S ribosomal protein L4 [Agrococcus sediminis]MDR7233385.1 large subunit ribosomal protein L4 [Agrococcus sp. BE272]RWR22431.1 50S ribosomal protein L4 [Agrococcus lahaulensis]UOV99643.1 50S ribosomal protein L4 [Agrococcus sp. SCSIO52902]
MTAQVAIVDAKGKQAGSVELPASIFDVQTNVPLIHQVVVAQLAAARQGTHSTKGRGEVSGAGRKPFKQKGTGRARQGSIRAPQMTGGGIVHGPTPRDYSQRTPKKMIAAALLGSLSDRARGGRLHVVETFGSAEAPKTRAAVEMLAALGVVKNVLIVLDRSEETAFLSVRNLTEVHVLSWDQLNAYDVLVSDDIVFSKTAYEAFVAAKTKGEAVVAAAPVEQPATADEAAPAAEAEVAEGDFGADSAAPLADGSAPEGFPIKGNANSMKFHRPEGRWFEQTEAEVWFRTAEAAEAAGFVEAGKGSKAAAADKDEN